MQRTLYRILIAASLALAPFAVAHNDQLGPGTPDFTCQTRSEWQVHDYAGANGRTVADISDNNLAECGTTYGLFIAGTPECRELETRFDAANPASPLHALWRLLCQTDRPADYDGDLEFALGGGLLAVEDGDGVNSGSLVCLGTEGHHGSFIAVQDQIFSGSVVFAVGADASIPGTVPPGEPDCGDNVNRTCDPQPGPTGNPIVDEIIATLNQGACNPDDHRAVCFGSCTVPFGPGAEGTYVVWVYPTLNGGPGGIPTGASHGHILGATGQFQCSDGVNNDGDAGTDWPHDDGCDTPFDNDENGNGIRTALLPFLPECTNLWVDDEGDGEADFFNPFTGGDPGCANILSDPEP